jgi:hypothetical protein
VVERVVVVTDVVVTGLSRPSLNLLLIRDLIYTKNQVINKIYNIMIKNILFNYIIYNIILYIK